MQNLVWALNALDKRQVNMRQGGRVKGGSTWELDSMLLSMYLPTNICCLFLVCQSREIATKSVLTHCKPCHQNWPVGTKIGNILPCRRHVADMSPTFAAKPQPTALPTLHTITPAKVSPTTMDISRINTQNAHGLWYQARNCDSNISLNCQRNTTKLEHLVHKMRVDNIDA